MSIKYRIEILPALKEAGYHPYRLRTEKIMGERTVQQLRNGELVSWSAIEKICKMLHCQPGDILVYEEESSEEEQSPS